MKKKIDYITTRIENWFDEVRREYGINGSIVSISVKEDNGGTISIITEEGGKETKISLIWMSEYTKERLFDIWAEKYSKSY